MTVGPTGSPESMAYDGFARLIDGLSRAHLREGHPNLWPLSPSELTSLHQHELAKSGAPLAPHVDGLDRRRT
jgi:hypothetical protein